MRLTCRCDPALIDRLERPVPARAALPGWLRTMPATAMSDAHDAAVRTVKQCPPFVDAMSHGVVLPLPCDVTVSGGRLSWDWDLPVLSIEAHPRAPLSFFAPAQVEGSPLAPGGHAIVKFNSFWTFETEPGWALLATHPANRHDLPFRTLTGLVDADRFHDVGILFPAVWIEPGFEGVLRRGTPVAQVVPVRREPIELACEPMDAGRRAAYEATGQALLGTPGVYRRQFRVGPARSAAEAAAEGAEVEP